MINSRPVSLDIPDVEQEISQSNDSGQHKALRVLIMISANSMSMNARGIPYLYDEDGYPMPYNPRTLAITNGEAYLQNTVQEIIPTKDFFVEIRGILDVEHLLDHAIVMLDVRETRLDDVIARVVNRINDSKRDKISFERDITPNLFSSLIFNNRRVQVIRHKLQTVYCDNNGHGQFRLVYDQECLTIYCSIDGIYHRHVAFVRMDVPTNFGEGYADIQLLCFVIGPTVEKGTKTAFETARTFSSLLSDPELRRRLFGVNDREHFIEEINVTIDQLAFKLPPKLEKRIKEVVEEKEPWRPMRGIKEDYFTRGLVYPLDYRDGCVDARAIQKTISTAVFLYFAILPTAIALGMLNDSNTHGLINVKKEILAQWIGGLFFGVLGGQLFLIMLSTAPISIYIQVIHQICEHGGYDFFKMFCTTGLWCSIFLIVFAVFEFSLIMKYAKRSLEELFGMFIAIALIYKAIQAVVITFQRYDPTCSTHDPLACDRSVGLLFVLLLCGTLWISLTLYNFRTTPFLTKRKRELLADYALPIGVIIMSLIASFGFRDIPKETFTYDLNSDPITVTRFWEQSWQAHLICFGLGIPLAILFFMDQLIVTNTVDNTQNNLQKGASPNYDLLIVALMNILLSILGLPWMHGALPQAFLHLKAQADVEDRLVDGTMQQIIVKNRESRVATLIAHGLMIPTYFYLLPFLQLIPTAVFHGLFLYLAFTSMIGNELCERALLIFTEQRAYPPLHYIRCVPQKIIHAFTVIEIIQLAILCFIGFCPWPVVEMCFPLVVFLYIPFRSLFLPCIFNERHLEALDSVH